MTSAARPTRAQTPARPRLLQAVVDAFQQPDIRQKLLYTLGLLVVFRFVAHVPIPGVRPDFLELAFENNAILGFFDLFSGGALRNLSVASLGVYPYITASIVMTLLQPIIPSLQAMAREGEQGRKRIQLYTHYLAVPMAVVQGYSQLIILSNTSPPAIGGVGLSGPDALPTLSAVISMTAGTMFLVWIGELITENGIGNGISLIIFGGIVAGLPTLLPNVASSSVGLFGILAVVGIGLFVLAAIVFMQEAQRRIPVQYARSVFRSGRMYRQSGQSHIPLRVNSAGMIPLIFAFSVVIFPGTAAQFLHDASDAEWVQTLTNFVIDWFSPQGTNLVSPVFMGSVFLLVVIFTFFYSLVIFQQQNLAENLQKNGGFVPGIRPGRPTAEYIMRVLVRITWGGAIFLGLLAIFPYLLPYAITGLRGNTALTLSGTSLLIIVGVVLDTMRQLESQLMMRNYEGFIR